MIFKTCGRSDLALLLRLVNDPIKSICSKTILLVDIVQYLVKLTVDFDRMITIIERFEISLQIRQYVVRYRWHDCGWPLDRCCSQRLC